MRLGKVFILKGIAIGRGVIGGSVIVILSEQVKPSKRALIRSAVREFEKEAEEVQGYLPAVIKLKNRLEGIGNVGDLETCGVGMGGMGQWMAKASASEGL